MTDAPRLTTIGTATLTLTDGTPYTVELLADVAYLLRALGREAVANPFGTAHLGSDALQVRVTDGHVIALATLAASRQAELDWVNRRLAWQRAWKAARGLDDTLIGSTVGWTDAQRAAFTADDAAWQEANPKSQTVSTTY